MICSATGVLSAMAAFLLPAMMASAAGLPDSTALSSPTYIRIDVYKGNTCTEDLPHCTYLTMGACYVVPERLANRNGTHVPKKYNIKSAKIASYESNTNTLVVNTYSAADCSDSSLDRAIPVPNALGHCETIPAKRNIAIPVGAILQGSSTAPSSCKLIPTSFTIPADFMDVLEAKLQASGVAERVKADAQAGTLAEHVKAKAQAGGFADSIKAKVQASDFAEQAAGIAERIKAKTQAGDFAEQAAGVAERVKAKAEAAGVAERVQAKAQAGDFAEKAAGIADRVKAKAEAAGLAEQAAAAADRVKAKAQTGDFAEQAAAVAERVQAKAEAAGVGVQAAAIADRVKAKAHAAGLAERVQAKAQEHLG